MRDEVAGQDLPITSERVVEAARLGDSFARSIIDEITWNLGIGIAGLIHTFDPEIIVIGGGVSEEFDLLYPGTLKSVNQNIYPHLRGMVTIAKAERGDDAGMLGAGASVFKANGFQIGL